MRTHNKLVRIEHKVFGHETLGMSHYMHQRPAFSKIKQARVRCLPRSRPWVPHFITNAELEQSIPIQL